jgi:L-threonylcarbamoyladenylate synthase
MHFLVLLLRDSVKTEIERIDRTKPDIDLLKHASKKILKGEVVVCPTDTGYAFSVNALNTKAIAKVFNLKGRSYSNPIHIAVSSIDAAEQYGVINEAAHSLAGRYLPGALTLVLPKKEIIPTILVAGRETIGIRIPDNNVILELAAMTGLPLTTTSANVSGQPTPYTIEEVEKQIAEAAKKPALVLDQGPIMTRELSTIVDLTVDPPQLIRQGLVSWLEIRDFLRSLSGSETI